MSKVAAVALLAAAGGWIVVVPFVKGRITTHLPSRHRS
jgi:hypothetical protein